MRYYAYFIKLPIYLYMCTSVCWSIYHLISIHLKKYNSDCAWRMDYRIGITHVSYSIDTSTNLPQQCRRSPPEQKWLTPDRGSSTNRRLPVIDRVVASCSDYEGHGVHVKVISTSWPRRIDFRYCVRRRLYQEKERDRGRKRRRAGGRGKKVRHNDNSNCYLEIGPPDLRSQFQIHEVCL